MSDANEIERPDPIHVAQHLRRLANQMDLVADLLADLPMPAPMHAGEMHGAANNARDWAENIEREAT